MKNVPLGKSPASCPVCDVLRDVPFVACVAAAAAAAAAVAAAVGGILHGVTAYIGSFLFSRSEVSAPSFGILAQKGVLSGVIVKVVAVVVFRSSSMFLEELLCTCIKSAACGCWFEPFILNRVEALFGGCDDGIDLRFFVIHQMQNIAYGVPCKHFEHLALRLSLSNTQSIRMSLRTAVLTTG